MPPGGESFLSYIQAQCANAKNAQRKGERRRLRPFVTISRESGACGITIADALAEYLRVNDRRTECPWTVFDKDILNKVAEENHLSKELLGYFPEAAVSEIKDSLEDFLGLHPSQQSIIYKTNKTILNLANLGYAIIVGRAANIVTSKMPGGVHVRLIGGLEHRIKHMEGFLKIDANKAREYVERQDKERAAYVRKYFEKDVADPRLYSVVINTGKVSIRESTQLIAGLVLKSVVMK